MNWAQYFAQKIREAIDGAIHDTKGELEDVARAGGKEAADGILQGVGGFKDLVEVLAAVGGGLVSPEVGAAAIAGAIDDSAGELGRGVGLGYIGGYMLYQMLNPLALPMEHEVNNLTQNQIFDAVTAADLAARGLIPIEFARSEAHGSGFDSHHLDLMERAAEKRPGLAELFTLHNRGLIDTTLLDNALALEGFNSGWRDVLPLLARAELGGPDLALAVLRGFMSQEEGARRAGEVGIVPEDFQTLMDNTGEPPGLMQLLELYRRGFIDQARLDKGIRESRVRNEWIPDVHNLRFERMSSANAVDAAVQHHLSLPDAKAAAARAGLDPEDFQVLYETAGQPISREEALELMHRGLMTQAQVEQAVSESHVKDKYIPNIIELGRRLIPYRTINTIIEHGVKDSAWGVNYLLSLGYTREDAETLVGTATSTKIRQVKALSEAQISELFQAKAITREDAQKLLESHGYTETEAHYALEVWSAQAALKDQRQAVGAVRAGFLKKAIDEHQASTDLDKLGVLSAERDQLLADWKIEIATRVKTLSEGQVVAAVYYGIMEYDWGVSKLKEQGYSENDARILIDIRLRGVPKGQPQPHP